jgi:predicted amidohydrolase
VERPVKVACVQVEPVVLDREATLDKLEQIAAEAAREGAELVVFPETFVPVYPSSAWAKALAGWETPGAKETFARLAQESVAVGSPAERRIGAAAKELGIWIVTGVNEVEPERPGSTTRSSTTRPRASSRSTTASSCPRTTSGSSGGRATAAGSRRSRPVSAGSAA